MRLLEIYITYEVIVLAYKLLVDWWKNYFQQFELRDGDCFRDDFWSDCDTDRERIEFSTEPRQAPKGKQCYGFSLMLSKDFLM